MSERRLTYPFTAIVGQERMQLALLLHAVNPRLGGVLIQGERGTAKSTAVRALAGLLPSRLAIEGCPFGCDPEDSAAACDACTARLASGAHPASAERAVPVVELPIGATEDRVLGSLDLERAIQSGERHFEPGLVARANGGILYIDEVNLLGDHLVDVLLDAAALGRNYVEREGISFTHPAAFMLIGTMNPEEGDLRPQLLDRFALTVAVSGLADPAQRAEVVRRRVAFESDPNAFVIAQAGAEEQERDRLARARALLPRVAMPDEQLELIARICAAMEVDGLRGDIAMHRTATALAAYAGRVCVQPEDIRLAAELALPHRRRRQPFEQSGLDQDLLDEVMHTSKTEHPPGANNPQGEAPAGAGSAGIGRVKPDSADQNLPRSAGTAPRELPEHVSSPGPTLALTLPRPAPRTQTARTPRGRRPAPVLDGSGAPDRAAPPVSERFELALAATLAAAAPHQPARRAIGTGPAIRLSPSDLRQRTRRSRQGALVVFIVDASGSMGTQERMSHAKSAVIGLLADAYRKRDRVGMVVFRDDLAELVLPPTNSVELAERRLRALPTGGRTPLALGLELAQSAIVRALETSRSGLPMLVLVSDARANVGLHGVAPWPAALQQAEAIRARRWPVLMVDAGAARAGAGLGRALAEALGAQRMPLNALTPHRRMEDRA